MERDGNFFRPQSSATILITVLAETHTDHFQRIAEVRAIRDCGARLAAELAHQRLPVTWAVDDPETSRVPDPLADSTHLAVALLADEGWLTAESSHGRVRRELSQRLAAAEAAGLSTVTLIPRDCDVSGHLEALARCGIRLLGGYPAAAERTTRTRTGGEVAVRLRHGIWQLPASLVLPTPAVWGNQRFRVLQRVRRQLKSGHCHLQISLADIARQGQSTQRNIDKIIRQLGQLRDAHRCEIASLSSLATEWLPLASTPQRSILKRAS